MNYEPWAYHELQKEASWMISSTLCLKNWKKKLKVGWKLKKNKNAHTFPTKQNTTLLFLIVENRELRMHSSLHPHKTLWFLALNLSFQKFKQQSQWHSISNSKFILSKIKPTLVIYSGNEDVVHWRAKGL